jgi:hypothetical protein
MDSFTRAYIETALWAEDLVGNSFAEETISMMAKDCERFISENYGDLFGEDPAAAGHDFWLTRNGHGAGFWDGDWPETAGKRLTAASHAYGEVDLYVGDDGKIYQVPSPRS